MHKLILALPLLLIGCATMNNDPTLNQRLQQRDTLATLPAEFNSADAQQLLEFCIELNNQDDRKIMLANLKAVDVVEFFDSTEELVNLMKLYKPDTYVKGSDWQHDKKSTAHQYCNNVIYFNRIGDYSSTDIISRCSIMDNTTHS